jgi:hypothetical protein
LKWYAEGRSAEDVDSVVDLIIEEMLEPEKHGLKRPQRVKRG